MVWPRTSDPVYADSLLALMGRDVHLPDGSEIRAILRDEQSSEVAQAAGLYLEIRSLRLPTRSLGTLVEGMVVTIDGGIWYVGALNPDGYGWSRAVVRRQGPVATLGILTVEGKRLVIPPNDYLLVGR